MTKKFFLSDLDGVYMNWTQGFVHYMASLGHVALHADPTQFAMGDIFPTVEKPHLHIVDYQHSDFYRDIQPYAEMKEAYKAIHAQGDVGIIAITSCGTQDQVVAHRETQLAREGIFDDLIILELGASKEDVLKKFKPSVFIEDQLVVAQQGLSAGHTTLLKDMPYNRGETPHGIHRIFKSKQLFNFT
jgi:hypothetical protein